VIDEKLKQILIENVNADKVALINETANLDSDLGIDSLTMLEIKMRVEDDYKIEITDEDVVSRDGIMLATVGDLQRYVTAKLAVPSA